MDTTVNWTGVSESNQSITLFSAAQHSPKSSSVDLVLQQIQAGTLPNNLAATDQKRATAPNAKSSVPWIATVSTQPDKESHCNPKDKDLETEARPRSNSMFRSRVASLFGKKDQSAGASKPPVPPVPLVRRASACSPRLENHEKTETAPLHIAIASDYGKEPRSSFDWSPCPSPEATRTRFSGLINSPNLSKTLTPAALKRFSREISSKMSSSASSSDATCCIESTDAQAAPQKRTVHLVADAIKASQNEGQSGTQVAEDVSRTSTTRPERPQRPPTSALPGRPQHTRNISAGSPAGSLLSLGASSGFYYGTTDRQVSGAVSGAPNERSPAQHAGATQTRGMEMAAQQPSVATPVKVRRPSAAPSLNAFDFELNTLLAIDEEELWSMSNRRTRDDLDGRSKQTSPTRSSTYSQPSTPRTPTSPATSLQTRPVIGARTSSRSRKGDHVLPSSEAKPIQPGQNSQPPLSRAVADINRMDTSRLVATVLQLEQPILPARSPLRERRGKKGVVSLVMPGNKASKSSVQPKSKRPASVVTPPPCPPPTEPLPLTPTYFDMSDSYLRGSMMPDSPGTRRPSLAPGSRRSSNASTSRRPSFLPGSRRPSVAPSFVVTEYRSPTPIADKFSPNRSRSHSVSTFSVPSPMPHAFPSPPIRDLTSSNPPMARRFGSVQYEAGSMPMGTRTRSTRAASVGGFVSAGIRWLGPATPASTHSSVSSTDSELGPLTPPNANLPGWTRNDTAKYSPQSPRFGLSAYKLGAASGLGLTGLDVVMPVPEELSPTDKDDLVATPGAVYGVGLAL